MNAFEKFRGLGSLSVVAACGVWALGCGASAPAADGEIGSQRAAIVDVDHTPVEKQSIGNCWIYANASWIESMHKSATGEDFDLSQSYWTYWHWYEQINRTLGPLTEVSTGGSWSEANGLAYRYGIVAEKDFVPEDALSEASLRQWFALEKVNAELKEGGRLATYAARANRRLVRQVLDEAWDLPANVRQYMSAAFGEDFSRKLPNSQPANDAATTEGTPIIAPYDFGVKYAARRALLERDQWINRKEDVTTTLSVAMSEWRSSGYWGSDDLIRRAQAAVQDRQPVLVSWFVDFNALENGAGEALRGSFNIDTLNRNGAGHQGWHMTVLEDYEVETKQFGLLKAGVTLDPTLDKDKIDAALDPSSRVIFFRVKNSWGQERLDRSFVPGFPGYQDLYLNYLTATIKECPEDRDPDSEEGCGSVVPLGDFVLPPGY